MSNDVNLTENFLTSFIAGVFRLIVAPAQFALRSHLGARRTGFVGFFGMALVNGFLVSFVLASTLFVSLSPEDVNRNITFAGLCGFIVVVGYFRNCRQAWRRRRNGDWTVNSGSAGESLSAPVIRFFGRRLCRMMGNEPRVVASVERLLTPKAVYYWIDPGILLVGAYLLWTAHCALFFYPVVLAFGLVVVQHHSELTTYLMAHSIPDGKMLEAEIMSTLEGAKSGPGLCVASIPAAPLVRPSTDPASVFERLSPELRALLLEDRGLA